LQRNIKGSAKSPDKIVQSDQMLLRVDEMRAAERAAMADGLVSLDLMERAGAAVAQIILDWRRLDHVLVLCGPGNNGGDGFVVARLLRDAGLHVRVACLVAPTTLSGDAASNAARWGGPIERLEESMALEAYLIVDALFGIGLNKPVEGRLAKLFARLNASRIPVVSVDTPSGVAGDSGHVLGAAILATLTVTFGAYKPCHLLLPGRALSGVVTVADIGLSPHHCRPTLTMTSQDDLPNPPGLETHKYARGHALALSGPTGASGAGRLMARAALRAGAGLVTLLSSSAAMAENAAHLTSVMLRRCDTVADLATAAADRRVSALGLGPGLGAEAMDLTLAMLHCRKPAVLDADALTAFETDPEALFSRLSNTVVLTPHQGEFERLFGKPDATCAKYDITRKAAERAGAVVLLKGPDTCIAAPDGRLAINRTGTPHLATAGSGDVLAGIILGFLAQPGVDAFQAACAGAWLHGKAAETLGRGLIAEDLVEAIPHAFAAIPR
jgi:ADP-dependent NAD(P)H-hydrate dehydratase / NAD(P)H-hydrate epimerase